ncbi:MAG TPA: hypothetical protein VM145_03755 [Sphingomicrobium sp.]|nr:hypothetical protein [Sphingomicrobium sp.]
MVALEVFAAFAASLAFLTLCCKGYAWHSALYTAIAFKSSSEWIYSRMPNVLNGRWWMLAIGTSALFAAAFATRGSTLLALALLGLAITMAYTGVRAQRLMKVAAREAGVPWPSDSDSG